MITVVGSLNIDLNLSLSHFPKQGETLLSHHLAYSYGGKGANQAVAISRLNEQVQLIGAIGDDTYGNAYLQQLKRERVDTNGIIKLEHVPTGTAVVMLAEQDNAIIVAQGANKAISTNHIKACQQMIAKSQLILLQFEISDEVIEAVLQLAKQYHIPVILNPAPFRVFPQEWVDYVQYITPNESEYAELLTSGIVVPEEKLILTKGKQGVSYFDTKTGKRSHLLAPTVKVIDTTGAGDTFNGALAVCLNQRMPLDQACQYAVVAASLSTQHKQAQAGMPSNQEVLAKLEQERNEKRDD